MANRTNHANAGRKKKPFWWVAEKRYIDGLRKRKSDGRWEAQTKNGIKIFTEADERRAVERFAELTGNKATPDKLQRLGFEYDATDPEQMAIYGPNGILSRGAWQASKRLWTYVAEQITSRPKWCAEQTGIEKLGYLIDLKPPEKLPELDELEKVWKENAKCSTAQMKKVLRCWGDFRKRSAIKGLRDITPETVVKYSDAVEKLDLSDKQKKHLFDGIRRLLRFARERAIARDDIARRLEHLELLKTSSNGTSEDDPKPIEVADWKKMLAAAETPDEKAMLLLMLNGAFYIGEVIDLRWDDIKDGCIVANRKKTGKCIRVCVLWKETIEALSQIEKQGDFIFYTYQGLPIKVSGAQRRWQQIALRAGLATAQPRIYKGLKKQVVTCQVTASQLRDGSYTAAVEANVNESICRLLAGHKSPGVQDKYVKRNPKMVAPACEAVHQKYFAH